MAMLLQEQTSTAHVGGNSSQSFAAPQSANSATLGQRYEQLSNNFEEGRFGFASWCPDLSGQSGRTNPPPTLEPSSASAVQGLLTTKAVSAIQELTRLERGWDGRAAVPVHESVALSAIDFVQQLRSGQLKTMRSVPFADGRLQLEWDRGERSLELEFASASEAHFLKWDPSKGIEQEGSVSPMTFPALNGLVNWFFNG